MTDANKTPGQTNAAMGDQELREFDSFVIGGQLFGIPVLQVRDVLRPQPITRIHLAPVEIAGSLNLRGRIVTALDIRHRLGLPPIENASKAMNIVVDHGGELYSLLVDAIGDVLSVKASAFEALPPTLDPRWREVTSGIYRLEGGLLVVLDIVRLLDLALKTKAA